MKAITLTQWSRMNGRQRSWLVHKVFGSGKIRTFWSLISKEGQSIGGSYDSYAFCAAIKKAARKRRTFDPITEYDPKAVASTRIVCCPCFPEYANYDHISIAAITELTRKGWAFSLHADSSLDSGDGSYYNCTLRRPDGADFSSFEYNRTACQTLAESICLCLLRASGHVL